MHFNMFPWQCSFRGLTVGLLCARKTLQGEEPHQLSVENHCLYSPETTIRKVWFENDGGKKQTRPTRGEVGSCSMQFPFGKVDARHFPSPSSFPGWATDMSMAAQLLSGPFAKQLEFLELEVFQQLSHTCVWNVFSTFDPSPEEQQRCHIQESSDDLTPPPRALLGVEWQPLKHWLPFL